MVNHPDRVSGLSPGLLGLAEQAQLKAAGTFLKGFDTARLGGIHDAMSAGSTALKAFAASSPATNALDAWWAANAKHDSALRAMSSALNVTLPEPILRPVIRPIAAYVPEQVYTALADCPRVEAPASNEMLVQTVEVLSAMRDEWAENAALERADRLRSERYTRRNNWITGAIFLATLIVAIASWLS
jgi:hypothetical protein